jgi:hypothetical protein
MIIVTGKSDWGGIHSNVESSQRLRGWLAAMVIVGRRKAEPVAAVNLYAERYPADAHS